MQALGLLSSALSRASGLAATFESLERSCNLLKVDAGEPLVKNMISAETQRTELEIIDALDDLDGEALTKTLWALDELRNARDAFSLVTEESALKANRHTLHAVSAMSSAIESIKRDTAFRGTIRMRQNRTAL